MKKTFIKDIFRTISKQKVSYFSIIVVAALAVTAYLGINCGAAALKNNADNFYKAHNYRDFEIDSTQLLTPEDIKDLKAVEGVTDVETFLQTIGLITTKNERKNVTIMTPTEKINVPSVGEGRLPETAAECAVDVELLDILNLKVGEQIELVNSKGETANLLKHKSYTITGSVTHPDNYAKYEYVPTNRYVFVTEDAFDKETLGDNVSSALLAMEKPENMGYFSNRYNKLRKSMKAKLDPVSDERSGLRTEEVRKMAQDKIDAGQKELDKAKRQLQDGRNLLDEKTKELKDGEALLQSAGPLLEEGKAQLMAAEEQLDAAEQKLKDGKAELDAGAAKIAETEKSLSDLKKEVEEDRAAIEKESAEVEKEEENVEQLRDGLLARYLDAEQGKTNIRNEIRAALISFAGEEFANTFIWAEPVTEPDIDEETTVLSTFAVTNSITLDLNDSFQNLENILAESLLSGTDYEGREEELKAEFAKQPDYPYLSENFGAVQETVLSWDSDHNDYIPVFDAFAEHAAEVIAELVIVEAAAAICDVMEEELQAGIEKYNAGMEQYQAGLNAWLSGKAELENGKAQYQQKLSEYISGLSKIEFGRTELAKGEKEYKSALEKYQDGVQQIEDAKAKLSNLSSCVWLVLDVNGNGSYLHALNSADNIKKLGFTFALLFVLVGALVIYVTTGRIIEESRQLVGTQKALGFYSREILLKYLAFGGSATFVGIILGTLLGYFGIQFAVIYVHKIFYITNNIPKTFLPWLFLLVLLIGLALAAGSITLATFRMVRRPARELMQDKAPDVPKKKAGKTRKKGRLLSRLIISNLIADKGRVAVTTISIAGCCILLMIGFTLQRGVQNAINIQFSEMMHYEGRVGYDSGASDTVASDIASVLDNAGATYSKVLAGNRGVKMGGDFFAMELTVFDPKTFSEFYTIYDNKTGEELSLPSSGAIITRRTSENFGLSIGDTITVYDTKMSPHDVEVKAICSLYFGRNIFMSNEACKEAFGEDPEPTFFYYNVDRQEETMEWQLAGIRGVQEVVPLSITKGTYKKVATSLTAVTILLIVAAGLMAYFVLLNLINMYLSQKKRELTIMRVNGFTAKEVIRYVSRESIITTIMGILLGLIVGAALGYAILRFLEQPQAGFDLRISWVAVALSTVITGLFSFVINAFGLRKVRKLKLTDISE